MWSTPSLPEFGTRAARVADHAVGAALRGRGGQRSMRTSVGSRPASATYRPRPAWLPISSPLKPRAFSAAAKSACAAR